MSTQPYPTPFTLDHPTIPKTTPLSPPRPATTAIPSYPASTTSPSTSTFAAATTSSSTPDVASHHNHNHTFTAPKAVGRRTSSRQTTLESLLGPTLRLPIPSLKTAKPVLPEIRDNDLRYVYTTNNSGRSNSSCGSEDEQDADDDYENDNGYDNNEDDDEEYDDDDAEEGDSDGNATTRSKEDPLASQVWKMYSKAKDSLDGQRMENMTWRMMSLSLNKKEPSQNTSTNQPRLTDTVSSTQGPSSATVAALADTHELAKSFQVAISITRTIPLSEQRTTIFFRDRKQDKHSSAASSGRSNSIKDFNTAARQQQQKHSLDYRHLERPKTTSPKSTPKSVPFNDSTKSESPVPTHFGNVSNGASKDSPLAGFTDYHQRVESLETPVSRTMLSSPYAQDNSNSSNMDEDAFQQSFDQNMDILNDDTIPVEFRNISWQQNQLAPSTTSPFGGSGNGPHVSQSLPDLEDQQSVEFKQLQEHYAQLLLQGSNGNPTNTNTINSQLAGLQGLDSSYLEALGNGLA
ncbi:hypothetical protein BGZ95_003458, partial [Linnemannia exigua]